MKTRKICSQVTEEIKTDAEAKSSVALDKMVVEMNLKDVKYEDRIQDASKPLYLKRYE